MKVKELLNEVHVDTVVEIRILTKEGYKPLTKGLCEYVRGDYYIPWLRLHFITIEDNVLVINACHVRCKNHY